MPYIKPEHREKYEAKLQALVDEVVEAMRWETSYGLPGHMNYLITSLIMRSYNQTASMEMDAELSKAPPMDYHDYNDIVGVLECAKMEVYRRFAVPYEDLKISTNGDIKTNEE